MLNIECGALKSESALWGTFGAPSDERDLLPSCQRSKDEAQQHEVDPKHSIPGFP